jgi:hypothetical protein
MMNPKRSSSTLRRQLSVLFDQQLWCLGQDVVNSAGNILLELGMCRYRCPYEAKSASTLYTAQVESSGYLFLWGFGAMYAEPGQGGVFLRRFDFSPMLTTRESGLGLHKSEQLGPLKKPTSPSDLHSIRHLLPRLVGWFAKYEHWINENYGLAYRNECLNRRGEQIPVRAEDMAEEWERASKKCEKYKIIMGPPTNPWQVLLHQLRQTPIETPLTRPSTRVLR